MAETVRKAVVASAVILTIIGMGLSIGAILTPSWQVVNLREYNSVHEHGLWLDCTRHTRDGQVLLRRYATFSEPLHCVYKFDYDKYSGTFDLEDDNSPVGEVNRHKFYGWHTATLILLAFALLTSFASICLGGCSCGYTSLSLVFTAVTLLTTFLSSVAEGLFFFFSHRADNRFIKGIVGTYEQRVGLAFFLQMGACFFHFIAFIVSMLATYFAFTSKDVELERDRFSLPNSSKTNMTNVGRATKHARDSNEAMAPLLPPLSSFSRPGSSVPPPYSHQQRAYGAGQEDFSIGGDSNANSTTFNNNHHPTTFNHSNANSTFSHTQREFMGSIEFEHPVFVQQPQKPRSAVPYYLQQQQQQHNRSGAQEEFDRAVADSMPELAHARSYQSEIQFPMRVRRKSETCV